MVGVALAVKAVSAIYGAINLDIPQAIAIEDAMYQAKVASHEITPHPRKQAESPDAMSPDAVR